MTRSVVLRGARVAGADHTVDVLVRDQIVERVMRHDASAPQLADHVVDIRGAALLPGFVESHIHLDKARLGMVDGVDLAGAIAATARAKARFTHDDVQERARSVVRDAVANGTTSLRAHTEVDPTIGLLSVHALLELRSELAGAARLSVAPFPQEGLLAQPGTLELLEEALREGADAIGGCPYVERSVEDAVAHIDAVLDLAEAYEVPADFHLDFADSSADPRFSLAAVVARRVADRGLHGRVALGHATSLDALHGDDRFETLDALAGADIAVTVLPATDLFLNGRSGEPPMVRGIAPVRELWARGVRTALSSNNIGNAFTPTGSVDLLDIALLTARLCHIADRHGFRRVLEMATIAGARILTPGAPVGVEPGARADFVTFDTHDPDEVVRTRPDLLTVILGGDVVFEHARARTWHTWPNLSETLARRGAPPTA